MTMDARWRLTVIGLAVFLACDCAPATPSVRAEQGFVAAEGVDLVAPPLPPLCTSIETGDHPWVFFSSSGCPYCRAMRGELARAQRAWQARGITIVELLVDAGSCEAALAVSRSVPVRLTEPARWAVGLADPSTVHAWGVERTPFLFQLHHGHARALFVGQTPVTELLAAHDRRAGTTAAPDAP